MQGHFYVFLKDFNVNKQLSDNRSLKILTGQDINLTFTSSLGTSFSPATAVAIAAISTRIGQVIILQLR